MLEYIGYEQIRNLSFILLPSFAVFGLAASNIPDRSMGNHTREK